jgi:hypothetical protein
MSGFPMDKTRPFYYKENIFLTLFFIKWSRLVDHFKSGFQMVKKQDGCHNLAAILFLPFEIWKKSLDFEWSGLA